MRVFAAGLFMGRRNRRNERQPIESVRAIRSIFCPPCFVWRYYDFNKVATGVTMLSYTEMAQLIERF
jgi:hypothetical protein